MTALPARNVLDGTKVPATTTSEMKTALGALRDYLNEALGSTGTTPALPSLNSGPLGGSRNFIINGGCRVAQRGSVAAVAGTYTYGGVDRICASVTGTLTAGNIQQLTGASAGVNGYSQAVAGLSVSTAGSVSFQTRLEFKDTFYLNSKTITISCKVYQDTGSSISSATMSVSKPTVVDNFTSQTTLQTSSNQTIPSGVLTPLSWTLTLGATDASLGLAATVTIPFASAITTKNICITDWQLEIGSVATPLERINYSEEETRCMRYLQKPANGTWLGSWSANVGTWIFTYTPYVVPMRATPTVISPPTGYTLQGYTSSATGFSMVVNSTSYSITSSNANSQGDGVARQVSFNSAPIFSSEL